MNLFSWWCIFIFVNAMFTGMINEVNEKPTAKNLLVLGLIGIDIVMIILLR